MPLDMPRKLGIVTQADISGDGKMDAVAYQFAVVEMLETLQYISKQWNDRILSEGAGRIDQINIDHVNKAIALATPVLTKARDARKC